MLLDTIYFLLRYTPFWAIPLMMISGQFTYIYWLKDIRLVSYIFGLLAGFCFVIIIYYIYQGSPDNAAKTFDDFIRHF